MDSRLLRIGLCLLITCSPLMGCRSVTDVAPLQALDAVPANQPSGGESYLAPYEPACVDKSYDLADSLSPDELLDYENIQYLPVTLAECVRHALSDSKVFRDLGGTIVSSPLSMDTTLDPALVYTNPTFGEDAALSAFDARYAQSIIFEKNDRPFNTSFTGDTNGIFQQDLGEFNFEMSKLAATGTRFTTRSILNYDDNNQAGNRFFHSWESIVEGEFRHPMMQGSGALFNRIAGPSQVPGNFNGVLIARTNTEISLADFQASVRDFIVDVENAYWDLYYAYRELNAQTDARDAAYEVFKNAEAEAAEQRVSSLEQASAYEQYLRFEHAVVESLEGRPIEGTQSDSGSFGGVFRRNVGVRVAERRLRYLIGMDITDGVLLQPADQPNTTPVVFDWNESLCSALDNRPETRRQRWVVKQKQLQLTAARNFLLPRLDLVGRYRFRGLGRSLTGGEPFEAVINSPNNNNNVSGALKDLGSGNFQEWQLGVEYRLPVGQRQAHVGVRNAELGLQRERTVLREQERRILLELSNSVAEVRRAFAAMSVAEQRYQAAIEYRAQAAERIEQGQAQFDVLLEAQRRVLESQIQFINAEVESSVAIRNVHFERGTLMDYHGVAMSENESDPRAYIDADRRNANRKRPLNYVVRDSVIANVPVQSAHVPVAAYTYPETQVAPGEILEGQIITEQPPLQPGDTMIAPGEPVEDSFGDPPTPAGDNPPPGTTDAAQWQGPASQQNASAHLTDQPMVSESLRDQPVAGPSTAGGALIPLANPETKSRQSDPTLSGLNAVPEAPQLNGYPSSFPAMGDSSQIISPATFSTPPPTADVQLSSPPPSSTATRGVVEPTLGGSSAPMLKYESIGDEPQVRRSNVETTLSDQGNVGATGTNRGVVASPVSTRISDVPLNRPVVQSLNDLDSGANATGRHPLMPIPAR